jgi:hypothetical protein
MRWRCAALLDPILLRQARKLLPTPSTMTEVIGKSFEFLMSCKAFQRPDRGPSAGRIDRIPIEVALLQRLKRLPHVGSVSDCRFMRVSRPADARFWSLGKESPPAPDGFARLEPIILAALSPAILL